jgi:hypothetical protein
VLDRVGQAVCGTYDGHNTVHVSEVCVGHEVCVVHTLDITECVGQLDIIQSICMKCVGRSIGHAVCVVHTLDIIQCVGHCWT